MILINEEVKCYNWENLLKSIRETSNYVLVLTPIGYDQEQRNASTINTHYSFTNLPNEIIIKNNKGQLWQVRLDSNEPGLIQSSLLKQKKRSCQVSWIYCISKLKFFTPFPWQHHTPIDPVVCNLSCLPVLIRMDHVFGHEKCLENPKQNEQNPVSCDINICVRPKGNELL